MNGRFIKESQRGYEVFYPDDILLRERKLFFTEEVTAESSNQFIQFLMCMEKYSPDEEIEIYINSLGGEVVSGLAVYDTLKKMRCPIRTVCIGTAASMGAIIFLAGDKREMFPHTKIMIHDPLINGLNGSRRALDLEREAQHLMETRKILGQIIADASGHSLEEVYEKTREDCYMTADEAIEYGIATGIAEKL